MADEISAEILPGPYDVGHTQNPPAKRPGRPRKTIDYEQARLLASRLCTYEEIAQKLGVSRTWLERDPGFRAAYLAGRTECKIGLRELQLRTAERGNVIMQMHLGKHYLGQTDKDGVNGAPVVIVIDKKDSAV